MNIELTQNVCPTCTGFGVLSQEEGGALTCTACEGRGMSLRSGMTELYYDLPALIKPAGPALRRLRSVVRIGLSILSFVLTAGSVIMIILTSHTLAALLWSPGLWHGLFGLSGLASMWALSHWNQHHTSELSLHSLPDQLSKQPALLDLRMFTNPRLSLLIEQAAYATQQLRAVSVDEAVLLLTLLDQPRIIMMLARMEISPTDLRDAVRKLITKRTDARQESIAIAPEVRLRILSAFRLALDHDFPYVDLEDVLLAYAHEPGQFTGIFQEFKLTEAEVYATTRWYAAEQERRRQWAFWLERGRSRPKGFMNRAWTALPTPFLDQYSLDMTAQAASGHLTSTAVRTAEIERILEVLGATQQHNVVLVGEPGVGKSAILDSIALRMLEENVPEILKDKRLVQLDLAALLTDSNTAEANVEQVVQEVAQAGNVILAIPDIQALVHSSATSFDPSDVLANALRQGALQVITTASFADYHRYVESNPALTSLLTTVEIKPLTAEQAIEVLEQEAPEIERHQHVFLTYPAIESAAKLAAQYVPDQPLPGSAIKLLDVAASVVVQEKRRWVQHTDVQKAVEKQTNIPVQTAGEEESKRLLNLEEHLHRRVVGQEEAVHAVSEALRRARAGLKNPNRPISSFLFVGPTGVGKTETAKAVADIYFGAEHGMIRLDMSEYQDNRSVYRLIGAPAATSESFTEGGALTQPIREHPFSLILLDEIEKADAQVLNLFLQLLDDGRLTENNGRTVHFNNCIIIATSNAGSDQIVQMLQQGLTPDQLQSQVLGLLQQHFKPEFLNRFDAIVPFHALRPNEVGQITELLLQEVSELAKEKGITLTFAPETVQFLSQTGYDPIYGARPLRRIVQDKVEGLLARLILEGRAVAGQTIQISPEMLQ